jgi:peroxiredoxin
MMKAMIFAVAAVLAAPASAQAVVGQPAPAFTAVDSAGKTHRLSDFRGKTVVLEWHNPQCPFVRKHYDGGDMQRLQADARAQGVVWLTVNSGAAGKQGAMNAAAANAMVRTEGLRSAAYIPDSTGAIGRAYGAKTTPHMFVINGQGTLVYAGGIDDKPTASPADLKGATNHVRAALADVAANRPVAVANTKPYGCSVKY